MSQLNNMQFSAEAVNKIAYPCEKEKRDYWEEKKYKLNNCFPMGEQKKTA